MTSQLQQQIDLTPGDGANAVPTTLDLYVRNHLVNCVFDYMTAPQIADILAKTGLIDVGAAVAQAIDALPAGAVLQIPDGLYNMGGTPLVIANMGAAYLEGVGMPEFKWSSLADGVDALTIAGDHHRRSGIKNLTLSLQFGGRDGIRLLAGDHPRLDRIAINEPKQDGLSIVCAGHDWVENLMAHDIVVSSAGRHAYYLETSGPNGAFINECVFEELECRGVSFKTNGGAAVYAHCGGTVNSKMSELQWRACNFDALRGTAVQNGFDISPNPMVLAYVPGESSLYEAWTIQGGAWETTSGNHDFRANGLVALQAGALGTGFNFMLGTSAGWSAGGIGGAFTDYVLKAQLGMFRTSYPNSWKQSYQPGASTFFIDIPLPVVPQKSGTRLAQGAAYELTLFAMRYAGTDKAAYKQDVYLKYWGTGADEYWSFIPAASTAQAGQNLFSVNTVTVVNASGATTLNSMTPPVAVRISVTTSALWGTGGGDPALHGLVTFKGATHDQYSY